MTTKLNSINANSIALLINTIAIIISTIIVIQNDFSLIFWILIAMIIVSLIANFIFLYLRFNQKIETIKSSLDKDYNSEFYKTFFTKIQESNQNIYITGRGLQCRDAKEKKIADDYANSLMMVLEKGVTIVRIQTTLEMSEYWSQKMAWLISKYSNFRFYILKRNGEQLSSICVFDPDRTRKNVVKISLPVFKSFGVEKGIIAGPAIFIRGNSSLAQSIQSQIQALSKGHVSHFIDREGFSSEKDIYDYLISFDSMLKN